MGRAVSKGMAASGAYVVVLDSDGAAAQKVVEEIGSNAEAVEADVTNGQAIEEAFAQIAKSRGQIDVLFNNAGINRRGPSLELSTQDWDAVVAVNMTGMFFCARAAARHMKRGGTIVNTASILGMSGGFYPNIVYQATKGAVVNMTRSWAIEWAPLNVRVNAVAPSLVRTSLTSALTSDPEFMKQVEDITPLRKLAEPRDIAGPVLFLASDASAMVTGHILPVDGGTLAQ
ncbi:MULTISPECIES: SDR family oxidoreductase [unclassified Rhizobium]|uniref:SDR family NAD(P)-dependent oxidoreductase n=1 Tax=unclassified Rhizobium TaxID=2613769 RepID=UPI0027D35C06|nr:MULTISPECIES: SDR family oxidoreductase [unclassified Rhizobium]MDQ4408739.1 SDR family oxidoreductase [Rhizobium sp. AN63]